MISEDEDFIDKLLLIGKEVPREVLLKDARFIVKMLRKKLHMTQRQLAKRTSLPQSHIAKIELGKISPSLETYKKIFKSLGCDFGSIVLPKTAPQTLLEQQALRLAERRVAAMMLSLQKEGFPASEQYIKECIEKEKKEILQSPSSRVWD